MVIVTIATETIPTNVVDTVVKSVLTYENKQYVAAMHLVTLSRGNGYVCETFQPYDGLRWLVHEVESRRSKHSDKIAQAYWIQDIADNLLCDRLKGVTLEDVKDWRGWEI